MKPRSLLFALAAVLLPHAGFAATSAPAAGLMPSALALPIVGAEAPQSVATTAAGEALALDVAAAPTVSPVFAVAPPRLESIRYRPRSRPRERERADDGWSRSSRTRPSGFSQIHGGFFDPSGEGSNEFTLGFRGGANVEDMFQLGMGLDWQHRSDRTLVLVSEGSLPGGGSTERSRELARSSSNLFPVMALAQFTPAADLPVIPYFGIAGGYEVLFLSAEDFTTGEAFDATFQGWGWQAWAGAALPLSGRSRLTAEVFTNAASLERDTDDPTTGEPVHEIIDLDGVGMRFGVNWGF